MPGAPLIFHGRDGTLNLDPGYVTRVEDLELVVGAADSVAAMCAAGAVVLIISNQSAIGRGMCREEDVAAVNSRLRALLLATNPGAVVSEIFFCPHRPEDECNCRKPRPGLIERVKARFDFDPAKAWMVGDKETDVQFGLNVGIPSNRCLTLAENAAGEPTKGRFVGSLIEASNIICEALKRS